MKRPKLLLLIILLLTSCTAPVIQEATPTFIPEPTATQTYIPTSTPPPSPTLAYSYLPKISVLNATEVSNFGWDNGYVSSLAFSPNGKYLAASFDNGAGIIWDISKGWSDLSTAPRDIFLAKGDVSFDPESKVLATGGTLIDLSTKQIIQELPGTIAFSPNGNTLASFDWSTISLWNLNGNKWIRNYKEDTQNAISGAFSPDGNLLGVAEQWQGDGSGEGVQIWRVVDHKLLYTFPPPEYTHPAHFNMNAFAFLAFSPDNQSIATGTKAQAEIRFWNLKTGELIKDISTSFAVNYQDPISGKNVTDYDLPDVQCATFTQDSKSIILAGADNIIFKTFPNGEFITESNVDPYYPPSQNEYITACATSEDGRLLAIGDSMGSVYIWYVLPKMP